MKLIVGLGNPGEEYASTRHNFGFMAVDHLQQIWNFPDFKNDKKFLSCVTDGNYADIKIILVKPQTYMNASGKAVALLVRYFKIALEDIIVIQDDLDLDLGILRFKTDSGSGGHKGIQSITEELGSKNFLRLKLGISNVDRLKIPAENFVLQYFKKEEKDLITDMLIKTGDEIEYRLLNHPNLSSE